MIPFDPDEFRPDGPDHSGETGSSRHNNDESLIVPFSPYEDRLRIIEDKLARSDANARVFMAMAEEFQMKFNELSARLGNHVERRYYTKEEAAEYLRTTMDGIYGRVERGQLERCPGVRAYLFTKEMLDDSVLGRTSKPRRNPAGRNAA